MKCSMYVGCVCSEYIGILIILKGWVGCCCDFGGFIFIDFCDCEGIM